MTISRVGKGTYYPGRTKPLNGVSLTPMARALEKKHATFASPCGNKGEVYRIEMIGAPGKYRYALLNDRIGHRSCSQVGRTHADGGKPLTKSGRQVPLLDLARGLAEYFGIKGKTGVGEFRITLIPTSEHDRIATEENILPSATGRNGT